MWFDHREELSAVIDVDELLSRCMGNLEFAERVLALLQDRCSVDIEELDRAVGEGDVQTIASIAHRLKGAYANAAAAELKSQAAQLEDAALYASTTEVEQSWGRLRERWNEFNAAVAKSVSGVSVSG